MNIVIWIVQILLAIAFLLTGSVKLTRSYDWMRQQMAWVGDFSPSFLRFIGSMELLAAIGLILPAATKILAWLTPLSGVGLVGLMIGAMMTHWRRHEWPMIIGNFVLLALAAFVAFGRFVASPI